MINKAKRRVDGSEVFETAETDQSCLPLKKVKPGIRQKKSFIHLKTVLLNENKNYVYTAFFVCDHAAITDGDDIKHHISGNMNGYVNAAIDFSTTITRCKSQNKFIGGSFICFPVSILICLSASRVEVILENKLSSTIEECIRGACGIWSMCRRSEGSDMLDVECMGPFGRRWNIFDIVQRIQIQVHPESSTIYLYNHFAATDPLVDVDSTVVAMLAGQTSFVCLIDVRNSATQSQCRGHCVSIVTLQDQLRVMIVDTLPSQQLVRTEKVHKVHVYILNKQEALAWIIQHYTSKETVTTIDFYEVEKREYRHFFKRIQSSYLKYVVPVCRWG